MSSSSPRAYDNYTYYGRGPINNYGDRKASQYIEQHKNKVAEQFVSFPKPQTMANREDVRWVSLTNASGRGMLFLTDSVMTSSALPYSAMQLIDGVLIPTNSLLLVTPIWYSPVVRRGLVVPAVVRVALWYPLRASALHSSSA